MGQFSSTAETGEDVLKKLDWILLADHSGSMGEPSLRMKGKTRLQEVQEDCISVARVAQKYDDDGITLVHFATGVTIKDNVTADNVTQMFHEIAPRGSTNLADALKAAVDKAKASTKETVVFVYTDGAPNDAVMATRVIEEAGRSLGRPRIGFVFIQVGTDPEATQFLKHLDSELKTDVCAVVHAEDAEELSVPQLVELARTA
jgi:Mg-chelatase subunit ChlD